MKKYLLISVLVLLLLCGCEKQEVVSIIPEGEYDLIELIHADGSKKTRDDFEEEGAYVDSMLVHVWKNNKGMIGKKSKNKYDVLITDKYFIWEEDKKTQLEYNHFDNKIEIYYDNGDKEIYVKDYRKELEAKYQEMIGHYEVVLWVNGDGIDILKNGDPSIIAKMKENTYLDISNNNKASTSIYTNMGGSVFKKYDYFYKINSEYFYNDEEKMKYDDINGKVTFHMVSNGKTGTMIFQKSK